MSPLRRHVLRADAFCLGLAAAAALHADVIGVAFGLGPQGPFLSATPQAAIGFIEAHGLALILAVLLWRAAPARSWYLTAGAVHALLGGANLVFWPYFAAADMVAVGYATTALHGMFVLLQLYAVFDEYCCATPLRRAA
jgi:hypothetical protein